MNTHGFRPPEPDMNDLEVFDYAVERLKFSLSTGGHYTPQGYHVPREYYDGVSPKHPRKFALEIVEESRKEKKEADSPNPYKIRPSRSFRASRLVFGKMKPLKLELRRRAVAGTVALDLKTVYIWYLEYLLYIALEYTWHQAAVAILKVLYILDYEEFRAVVNELDYSPQRFPPHLRNQKERTLARLMKQFQIFGLETEKIRVGSKIEEHFKRADNPAAQVELVAEILRKIRPVKPPCTLHAKSGSGVELLASLELLRKNRAPKNFDNEAEMEIMQLLTCPYCLSITFEALGISNWREKLGLPFLNPLPSVGGVSTGGGGGSSSGAGGTTQMSKSNVVKTEEEETAEEGEPTEEDDDFDLQAALERREERRRNMPLDHVLVVSDNATWVRVSLDQPVPEQLHLLPGDTLIEIMGRDDEGTLPLDYHEVSWDPDLDVKEPHVFVTELKDDRRVELTVTYEKDDGTGDLIAATVDVTYMEGSVADDGENTESDEPGSGFWKVAALAAAVTAGAALGATALGIILIPGMSSISGQKSDRRTSNSNTAIVTSKASSPSPTTSPETLPEPPTAPAPLPDLADKPKHEGSGSPATAQVPEGAQPTPQEVVTPQSAETTTAQSPAPPPAVLPSPADTAASNVGSLPESSGVPPSEGSSSAGTTAAREGTSAAAVPDGGAPPAVEALREGVINVKVTYLGEEIQDARVTLADESSGVELAVATFGTDGNYSFPGLKTGSYKLKVEKEGFQPENRNIEVKPGKTLMEEVRIQRIGDDPAPEPEYAVPAVASAAYAPRAGRSYGHVLEATPGASPFRRERNARLMPLPLQSRNIYEARGASVAPRRASAPPSALMFVEVDIDQPICVSLFQPLSSLDSRVGQTFRTSVLKTVYADGIEAIPEGSIILGTVSRVRKAASSPDGKGMIAVQFTSLYRPTDRAPYDIKGELRGLADDPVAADRRPEAIVTSAPPLTNPRMVFVGDEEKGFRVAPIDEAAAAPAKNDDDATRHATPKDSEAVVGASARVCLSLERKLRLPVLK